MMGGFTGSYLGAVRYNAKTIQNVMGFVVIHCDCGFIKGYIVITVHKAKSNH